LLSVAGSFFIQIICSLLFVSSISSPAATRSVLIVFNFLVNQSAFFAVIKVYFQGIALQKYRVDLNKGTVNLKYVKYIFLSRGFSYTTRQVATKWKESEVLVRK
jgi:hypothetical protein